MKDVTGEGRWYSDDGIGLYRYSVGIDETVFPVDPTPEQGAAFVAGKLDYCHSCKELVEPFEGEHCAECEAASKVSDAEQDARDTGLPLRWFSHQSSEFDHDGNPRRWQR